MNLRKKGFLLWDGLLRLAAQQQTSKAGVCLERDANCTVFNHRTDYTGKKTFCKHFFFTAESF
jgi:hypothetical protein